jgi:hypothetical protein
MIDMRHNVHHTRGIGLKGDPCFAMTGAHHRRGERDVLRAGRLSRKHDRQPIHWLILSIRDAHHHFARLWQVQAGSPKKIEV